MKKVFYPLILFLFFISCNNVDKIKEAADEKAKV